MSGHRILMLLASPALATLLWGCPPQGPTPVCPPCAYSVPNKQLSGRMAKSGYDFPLTSLVVTLTTTDGVKHPIDVKVPDKFTADLNFEATVPTTITTKVQTVDLKWKDKNGNTVTQDGIPH